MNVLAANPLISVTPGLMIWTIVCFLIALFVLKRYAFGPIQTMIDARREQIRNSLEEADNARDEARRLLDEHRKLIGQARSEAEQILGDARRTGEAMEHRMREETEAERQRRIEETRREIAAETARALEQIRNEVADLTLAATSIVVGRTLDSDRDRELITEALFSAAKEGGRLGQVHEALSDFAAAIARTPELRAVLRNPQLDPSVKAAILTDLAGDDEPLFKNFLLLVTEKERAAELEEIAKEFERLIAREERRLDVELITARELTDEEADAIVDQIEKAAGRKVDATRSVDPELGGGIVLQAGSYRADASVRGRLERLRQELVRS